MDRHRSLDRLNPLDVSNLRVEEHGQPMHVAALVILDQTAFTAAIRWHHVVADGIAALGMLGALFDPEPQAPSWLRRPGRVARFLAAPALSSPGSPCGRAKPGSWPGRVAPRACR